MAPLLQLTEESVELKFLFKLRSAFSMSLERTLISKTFLPAAAVSTAVPTTTTAERSVLGLASFTVIVRSMNVVPFMAVIALAASSSDAISTKPKPLDLPLA